MTAESLIKGRDGKALLDHLKDLKEPFFISSPTSVIVTDIFLLWSFFMRHKIIIKTGQFEYVLNPKYKNETVN